MLLQQRGPKSPSGQGWWLCRLLAIEYSSLLHVAGSEQRHPSKNLKSYKTSQEVWTRKQGKGSETWMREEGTELLQKIVSIPPILGPVSSNDLA